MNRAARNSVRRSPMAARARVPEAKAAAEAKARQSHGRRGSLNNSSASRQSEAARHAAQEAPGPCLKQP